MIYLAVPYTGMEQKSFEAVTRYAGVLMKEGHYVFSPITMCHPIAQVAKLPTGFSYWEQFDFHLINLCNCMVVLRLDGWEDSKGIRAECIYAASIGRVVYMRDETDIPSEIDVIDGVKS